MWTKYAVKIKIRDKLLGGVPQQKEVVEAWLKTKGRSDLVDEAINNLDLDEEREKVSTTFYRDELGLFIWAAQVKAMLKECAQTLGFWEAKRGLRGQMQHATFVHPDKIYLGKDKPDGCLESVGHVIGLHGPRSILKREDFVLGVEISFEVWTLDSDEFAKVKGKILNEKELKLVLELAQENGLGASRSMGHGKFDLVEFNIKKD